jgi:mitogen-activated protein kinase 15
VLLGSPNYGKPSDIWGFGCTMVELYIGKPAFPGQSTLNQLARIIEVTGLPSELELAKLSSPLTYGMFKTLDVPENHKTLTELVKNDDPDLLDLLGKIFVFSPERRITIEQILKHPYFHIHHDEELEYKNNKRVQTDG